MEEEKEVAVRFGIAPVKVDQVPVSSNCICILFCIPVHGLNVFLTLSASLVLA